MFLTSTDLKETIVWRFKKLAANLLICLFQIISLDFNESANFQCGKVFSSSNATMGVYGNFHFPLTTHTIEDHLQFLSGGVLRTKTEQAIALRFSSLGYREDIARIFFLL